MRSDVGVVVYLGKSFLGVVACWYGMVLIVGSSVIPSVVLCFVVPLLILSLRFLGVHMCL